MYIRGLYWRVGRYYRTKGFFLTMGRIFAYGFRNIFRSAYVLFYVDMEELKELKPLFREGAWIECKHGESEIESEELRALCDRRGGDILRTQVRKRFSKGALLWLIKEEGEITGFIWSTQNGTIKPYFLPLSHRDVHLFDNEIFPEYRGKGLNGILINYVLHQLQNLGAYRAFIETPSWNHAEMRSLAKTPFRKLAIARKIGFRDMVLTLWRSLPKNSESV